MPSKCGPATTSPETTTTKVLPRWPRMYGHASRNQHTKRAPPSASSGKTPPADTLAPPQQRTPAAGRRDRQATRAGAATRARAAGEASVLVTKRTEAEAAASDAAIGGEPGRPSAALDRRGGVGGGASGAGRVYAARRERGWSESGGRIGGARRDGGARRGWGGWWRWKWKTGGEGRLCFLYAAVARRSGRRTRRPLDAPPRLTPLTAHQYNLDENKIDRI